MSEGALLIDSFMATLGMASSMPLPQTDDPAVFTKDVKSAEKKKRSKLTKPRKVEPIELDEDAPVLKKQAAWGTPKGSQVPDKLKTGRSSRLFL